MIEIANVSLSLDSDLSVFDIVRLSVDARRKSDVHFVATIREAAPDGMSDSEYAELLCERGKQAKVCEPFNPLVIPDVSEFIHRGGTRPLVVGMGPAGLFAALYLARAGLRPIVIDRGSLVEERVQAVERFRSGHSLDPNCNVQFGEGGAGTFSDGKLTTNIKNPLTKYVLQWLHEAGAPDDILIQAKPHIGTDLLRNVVRALRLQIQVAGGEVHFNTILDGLNVSDGSIREAALRDVRDGSVTLLPVKRVILACGHSARDTFALLHELGVTLSQKPFSVGVRIEHEQRLIDEAQYGSFAHHPALGAADYKLSVHLPNGRSVYTFCMCPGGEVVCAASEPGGVVVNGMSYHARDGKNANSALLVGVGPEDFGSGHPLAGVEFQRKIEQAAYRVAIDTGGSPYQAPCQTVGNFLASAYELYPELQILQNAADGKERGVWQRSAISRLHSVDPTYARGCVSANLCDCLPRFVAVSLARALPEFDRRLHGFADAKALMTGVETRSSSPVRIVRDEQCQASLRGLFPCGEGAGYAGGIMSAAADGLKVARALVESIELTRVSCGEFDDGLTDC